MTHSGRRLCIAAGSEGPGVGASPAALAGAIMERQDMTMSTDHVGCSPETAERLKRIFDSLESKDAMVAV
jgi:hypothetical protein